MDTFPLESDQSVHSSTFLDANGGELDLSNLQHPGDTMEITVPESVPEDRSFATQKEVEDTNSEDFTLSKDHHLCTTKAEITHLLSLQQRNDDLEEKLFKEQEEKDYYKKLYDEALSELLELRAMWDNFLLISEEKAKTADTCMIVAEPKETISNETISEHKENISYIIVDPDNKELVVPTLQDSSVLVETHAPQPAQLETSAATTEGSRDTRYISLDTISQDFGTSLDITSLECDLEQTSTLGGGPLKGTQDTERSKESQILCELEAEKNKVLSLHQRVSTLETELSEEKDQKFYYSNLSNEFHDELLKLRAILENNTQTSKHKTAVLHTSSSSESDGNDYEDENIKEARRSADELECEVKSLSELTEKIKKLTEPCEANPKGTFSLETDRSAHSSTFLDAEQDDHDVLNLQHPSVSMETTVPESVPEDTSFATSKKFEDTKSEEFTICKFNW
ncbi:uncharacterized protein LOC107833549 [Poecilia formosa]|uniref:uncharacterized protein LOC107833549 n=1 Tax=Poecilia formosa TaxID=48698 RepID=UPI0007B877C1|nr:PREDICTED: uncharacterized protein LOC107833549 [Poecilia formosa]